RHPAAAAAIALKTRFEPDRRVRRVRKGSLVCFSILATLAESSFCWCWLSQVPKAKGQWPCLQITRLPDYALSNSPRSPAVDLYNDCKTRPLVVYCRSVIPATNPL